MNKKKETANAKSLQRSEKDQNVGPQNGIINYIFIMVLTFQQTANDVVTIADEESDK